MTILVAGELNADLVLQNYSSFPAVGQEVVVDNASLTLGSSSAICASGLAKLGNAVIFAGKIGRDLWGDLCLDWLAKLGVDCSPVLRDPGLSTGITVSITSEKGRALVTYPGATTELRASEVQDEDLLRAKHLHVSSFFLQTALRPGLRALFERAHCHGLTTSLDPGFDPEEKWAADLLETLREVDFFFPNESELRAITNKADPVDALQFLSGGRTTTIAKLGENGSVTLCGGHLVSVPAYSVRPLDTTGAGDSFNAGFLHAWLRNEDIAGAMAFGAACGALSTLQSGGTAAQPTEAEAIEFMRTAEKGAAAR